MRRFFSSPDGLATRPVVWLLGFFAFLNVYSMQAVLPLVMAEFGATPVEAGATVGATVLGIALVSPFMGMLSDALGRKGVLCWSILILTIPTALIPMAGSLGMVLAMRFLQGLAVPGIVVVLMAYIGEEYREGGGVARMTATYVSGTVMGGFSGRFITGHMAEYFGWRGAFVALALMNLSGVALAFWKLPPSRFFVPNRRLGAAFHTLLSHLANPRLMAACAVGGCVLFSLVGSFTYANILLAREPYRLSVAALGNVFCVYLLGVAITPYAGRLIARYGYRKCFLTALALSASGLALTLWPSVPTIIGGLAICASGIFVCQAAAVSFIAANVSTGRSLATGLYNLSYYAGGFFGAWLAGLAFEWRAWPGAVLAIALAQLLAACIAGLGWREPRP